jgi:hypothetical protein
MIDYDDLLIEDLCDEFEYLSKDKEDFSIDRIICKNVNRAFIFGYIYDDLKRQFWVPISIRKKMRYLHEEIDMFVPQIKWLNDKYGDGREVDIKEYSDYILSNVFYDNDKDLLNLAIGIGRVLKQQKNEQSNNTH